MEGNTTKIKNPASEEVKDFKFNKSFWSHDSTHGGLKSNKDVFLDLGTQLLNNAFAGFNATIFAYGQTGSGKSYSVEGTPSDQGLLQRICEEIFGKKKELEGADAGNSVKVECSYLEIYNEKLRDLFDPSEK